MRINGLIGIKATMWGCWIALFTRVGGLNIGRDVDQYTESHFVINVFRLNQLDDAWFLSSADQKRVGQYNLIGMPSHSSLHRNEYSNGLKIQGLIGEWIDRFTSIPHLPHKGALRKKVEPIRLHPGAVLENGATSEGGAVFSLNNHVRKKR